MKDLTQRDFNPDSPKQLREVLFDDLKLPVQNGPKPGRAPINRFWKNSPLHPLPAKIIAYRQLAKLKGTYLDTLPKLIHPKTGRIHASFNQVVAATGRLSSSDPNLQNIPIRTAEGRQIRKAFIPGESGWELLCCDYSQIELRVLAHFSGDDALQQAFRDGKDIHTAVAAEVFEVDESDVDADMRRVAKAVNFGVIYGQSPFGLAAALNIPQEQAAEFIDDYFRQYPGVTDFIEQTLEQCVRTGYAYTILGRRRPITGIKRTGGRNRNMPERTAINTVIQGSAADLIKVAMLNVHRRLQESPLQAKMLLQIHDELVFEAPADEMHALAELVHAEMTTAMELTVPLVVDQNAGPTGSTPSDPATFSPCPRCPLWLDSKTAEDAKFAEKRSTLRSSPRAVPPKCPRRSATNELQGVSRGDFAIPLTRVRSLRHRHVFRRLGNSEPPPA